MRVVDSEDGRIVFDGTVPYLATFGYGPVGEPLSYLNSLNNVALAIDQGAFAGDQGIRSGPGWEIPIIR